MFQSAGFSAFQPLGLQETLKVNRMAFHMAYQLFCTFQDHMEEMTDIVMEYSPVPQKLETEEYFWRLSIKDERENLKKTIDEGFEALEELLISEQPENMSQKMASMAEESVEKEKKSPSGKNSARSKKSTDTKKK